MKVSFFHRYPVEGHVSIEGLFKTLRACLPKEVESSVHISRYPSQGFFKRFYNVLEAIFRQGDINHITGDVHYLAILLQERKTILTIHDCGFMQHPHPLARFLLLWFWLRLPVMRSRYVTVISEATRQDVLRYTGCSAGKVRLIPNFVPDTYTFKPKAFRSENPLFLQIGTKANKNIPRLAAALQGICCELLIIGRPREEDLSALSQYGIPFRWQLNLSEEEMRQAYEDCDALLFASTSEGFGLPIIEAQAVGRPVLTSDCSSMPEVAGAGACLVDPFDIASIRQGIMRIIHEPAYREKLVEEGLKNIRRFRPEAVAEQYYRLYQEINA